MPLVSGEKILFIGDSITSAGRDADPEDLGFGYVRLVRDMLWVRYPECEFEIVNRGVGGDTVRDLAVRWERDAVGVGPDLAVVSIGVNDVWRQWPEPEHPDGVPLAEFEATYRRLLARLREACGCRFALCEPSIIGERREDPHTALLAPYIGCVRGLAEEFGAVLVPMNAAF